MCLELTDITIEFIDTTLIRSWCRTFVTSSPLTKHTRAITLSFHYLRQNDVLWIVRMLTNNAEISVFTIINRFTLCPIFLVSTHFRMTWMLSCHKAGTRWSTHWSTSIRLCEAHTLLCHSVNIRCKDVLLPVTTKVTIPHIIAHNVDNVRTLPRFLCRHRNLSTSQSCYGKECLC